MFSSIFILLFIFVSVLAVYGAYRIKEYKEEVKRMKRELEVMEFRENLTIYNSMIEKQEFLQECLRG